MASHRTTARKLQTLSAEMRTNLDLMRRSKRVTQAIIADAQKECALYLARTILNYPPSMRSLGLRPHQPLSERKQILGVSETQIEETPETQDFQKLLETQGRKSLKANWIWRIGQEANEKALEQWYGFFVTLTVDPSKCPDSLAMWKEGREFRKYIRDLAKVSAKACGMPKAIKNGASDRDFIQHVGVIEHGSSRHHHHMHLLIWMRGIPESWKLCPNRGIRRPEHRTLDYCKPMGTYWKWSKPGIGRAKYFRHEGDQWSRLGFALPYDSNKGRVIRIHAPEKAGLYIAKYMDKDDKVWLHRIKATRNLGLSRLKMVLMNMHLSKIEALSWRPRTYSLSVSATTTHTCPNGLLRSLAKQETFFRKWVNRSMDWAMLLQENCDSFSRMLQSVRDGDNPRRMRSKELYDWVTEHLPEPTGYCEQRYRRAITSLGVHFPPTDYHPVNHTGMT